MCSMVGLWPILHCITSSHADVPNVQAFKFTFNPYSFVSTSTHALIIQPLTKAVTRNVTDLSVCMCVQYGGSEAHSTFFQRQRGDWEAATQSRDLMTSIRRFYSNAYTDAEKQDAINLFLGNFVPHHGHAALWELDSDYFLHAGMDSDCFLHAGMDSDYFLHAGMDTRLMAVVDGAYMQLLWLFVI